MRKTPRRSPGFVRGKSMPRISYLPENFTYSLCEQSRPDWVTASKTKGQYLKDLPEFVLQFCSSEDRMSEPSPLFSLLGLNYGPLFIYISNISCSYTARSSLAPGSDTGPSAALPAAHSECNGERSPDSFISARLQDSKCCTSSLGGTDWPNRIRWRRSSWLSVRSRARSRLASQRSSRSSSSESGISHLSSDVPLG